MKDIKAVEVQSSTEINKENGIYYPITINGDGTTFTIVNNGTAPALCCLTLVPVNDAMKIEIEGLSKEKISLAPIKKDQVVRIDGIRKTITLDGKENFEIFNGWEFPKLLPGENTIKITKADSMKIEIAYQTCYI